MKSFSYRFRNTKEDFFLFNMSNIYSQWTAIVNIIFTVAMIILLIARWNQSGDAFRILMILGVMLFPVIQPLFIMMRSARQAESITEETSLEFDNSGMMIQVRNHKQQINWDDFNGVIKRPGTLIVMPDGKHAYILTNRVVHDEMNDLYEFIKEACCGKKN